MEQCLSIQKFCFLTGYKKQTVYNWVYEGKLVYGRDFIKPSLPLNNNGKGKGKILLRESFVEKFIGFEPDNKQSLTSDSENLSKSLENEKTELEGNINMAMLKKRLGVA